MAHLEAGTKVPSFKTIDQNENEVSDANLKGKKTVLYFYPKDDTPTCTTQACNLRDNYDALIKVGYQVYGVSPDKAAKHQKFIAKYDLPFDLLVDEDHSLAEAFGVWGLKKMYGREYMGINRTTFVIDEEGTITEVIAKVKAKEHSTQILG